MSFIMAGPAKIRRFKNKSSSVKTNTYWNHKVGLAHYVDVEPIVFPAHGITKIKSQLN